MNIADVRILRLAAGTAASLWVSQAVAWQLSFVAPAFTLLILALPLPQPKFKAGIALILVLTLSIGAGLLLLRPLLNYPLVGLLLLGLALFHCYYYTASGGSELLSTFATIGIALSVAVGSVSIDAALTLSAGLLINAAIGISFVWIAHALVPDTLAGDGPGGPPAKPAAAKAPEPVEARWSAARATLIVFPIAVGFMLSPSSAPYVPVMIKVAAMGQQASVENARTAGRSFTVSTIIGGAGAIIAWQVLSIAPTLVIYTLLIALAGLVIGPRIFGGKALQPDAGTWSYGYLTMIIILAPSVMDTGLSNAAGVQFWSRLQMFLFVAVYGSLAMLVVDALRPRPQLSGEK